MIGWALRTALLWLVVGCLCLLAWENRAALMTQVAAPAAKGRLAPREVGHRAANTILVRPDSRGHFVLDGEVNGGAVRFLVDTGASYVTLNGEDARAAGLRPETLDFSATIATANGEVRVAPVTLRELRLGQLVLEDVPGIVVTAPLHISLLGMSFLDRLEGYAIREGALAMEW